MIHRGVALILILATLLVVTSCISISMMIAADKLRRDTVTDQARRTLDMLSASETIVTHWLNLDSAFAVVDTGSQMPYVPIETFDYTAGTEHCRLAINAWDLRGMIPNYIDSSHTIWETIDRPSIDPGIESLAVIADSNKPVHPSSTNIAIGGNIAFFPISESNLNSPLIAINVNSAPLPLLEFAVRATHSTELDAIVKNRGNGTVSKISNGSKSNLVQLITRSTLWAVRVDATCGSTTRSWWTVYNSNGRNWSIVDRHEITD